MNRVVVLARQCWNFRTICGGQESSRNSVVIPARQAPQAGGIDSFESIPRFIITLKIPSLVYEDQRRFNTKRAVVLFLGPTGDTGPKHCRGGWGEKGKDDRKHITLVKQMKTMKPPCLTFVYTHFYSHSCIQNDTHNNHPSTTPVQLQSADTHAELDPDNKGYIIG